MKFIFAENMDLVDPNFDFAKDRSSSSREPYWDDVYPHQLLGYAPYNGLLVSRAIVGGHVKAGSTTKAKRCGLARGARNSYGLKKRIIPIQ